MGGSEFEASSRLGWRTFSVTSVGAALQGFVATSVAVALPAVARELNASNDIAPWFVVSYSLTSAVLILALGQLSDRMDRRWLYVFGLGLLTLASGMCGLAPSAGTFICFRVVQAVAAAILMSSNAALLTDAFPRPMWGTALGMHLTVSSSAQVLGPVLGGLLTDLFGWRALFLSVVPLGLGGVLWGIRSLRTVPARHSSGFDFLGAILSVPAIGGPVLVLLLLGQMSIRSKPVLVALTVSVVFIAAFAVVESRHRSPVVPLRFLRQRIQALPYLSSFLVTAVRSSLVVSMALYFQVVAGMSIAQAGLLVCSVALGLVAAAPVAGQMTRRMDVRVICAVSASLSALGLITTLGTLLLAAPAWITAAGLFAAGLGIGGFLAPNTTWIMRSVPEGQRGAANGLRQACQMTGDVFGSAFALAVVSAAGSFAGQSGSSASVFASGTALYGVVLLINITLMALAAASCLGRVVP